ncbi:MAG: GTPase Era [Clostridia bacterium]|nr:GTPase Era [Clostridia bacterium]
MTDQNTTPFLSGFVAILGRPNVGKSTLINALVGEKIAIVSDRPQTTRNRIMGVRSEPGVQMVFLDTPGLHKPRTKLGEFMVRSAKGALEGIDALLVMVDATQIGGQDRQLLTDLAREPVTRVLALNKIDLLGEDKILAALADLAETGYDHIVPISAATGRGLPELLAVLRAALPEGPRYFPDDMVTDQPERMICAEIIREKALARLREEVPHGIGVEMMSMQPLSDTPNAIMEIHATIYCERPSHKGILIGKQGAMLKAIGTAARLDIEGLLGVRVSLQLWIKVREDWRNRADDLRTLGYE